MADNGFPISIRLRSLFIGLGTNMALTFFGIFQIQVNFSYGSFYGNGGDRAVGSETG